MLGQIASCQFWGQIVFTQQNSNMAADRSQENQEDVSALLSSDDEASEVDPFRHRIKMSPLRWLRTYLLTPILVPIRFICLIIVVCAAWLTSWISLYGLTEEEILSKPMTGWRHRNKKVASFFGRLAFRY